MQTSSNTRSFKNILRRETTYFYPFAPGMSEGNAFTERRPLDGGAAFSDGNVQINQNKILRSFPFSGGVPERRGGFCQHNSLIPLSPLQNGQPRSTNTPWREGKVFRQNSSFRSF